jgi:hypothetical protein
MVPKFLPRQARLSYSAYWESILEIRSELSKSPINDDSLNGKITVFVEEALGASSALPLYLDHASLEANHFAD